MPLAKEKFWVFLTILFYLQTLKAGEDTHTSDVTVNSNTTFGSISGNNTTTINGDLIVSGNYNLFLV